MAHAGVSQIEKMFRRQFSDLDVISGDGRTFDSFKLTIYENYLCSFANDAPVEFCLGRRCRRSKNQTIRSREQGFNFRLFVGGVFIRAADQVLITEWLGDRFYAAANLSKVRVHQIR